MTSRSPTRPWWHLHDVLGAYRDGNFCVGSQMLETQRQRTHHACDSSTVHQMIDKLQRSNEPVDLHCEL
jgi:hypothetical protein